MPLLETKSWWPVYEMRSEAIDCRTNPERRSRCGQVKALGWGNPIREPESKVGQRQKKTLNPKGNKKKSAVAEKILQNPRDHFSRIVLSNLCVESFILRKS